MALETVTFTYSGAEQQWVVPTGVTEVTIDAYGAQGGGVAGGAGGRAQGVLAVTPGETLRVYVGGAGGYSSTVSSGGSGGGGASDVRQGGSGLANRRIVAAGGGGMGYASGTGNVAGGAGGGTAGANGTKTGSSAVVQFYGAGGTQSSGGSGGGGSAQSGSLGVGGNGGSATPYGGGFNGGGGGGATAAYVTAGGGGGYYGGGGSAALSDGSTAGSAGGGSGYTGGVTSGSMQAGVRSGDGEVSITYESNNPPSVPVLQYPTGNVMLDRTVSNQFDMGAFSDPDAGDSLTAYDLRYAPRSTTSWTTVSGGATRYHTFSGGTFAAGDWDWQARYYDSSGAPSGWSSTAQFRMGTPPNEPTIVDPINGGVIEAPNHLAEFTASGAFDGSEWRTVADSAGSPDVGTVYWSSGVINGTGTTYTIPFATDGRHEHLQVRLRNDTFWSSWYSVRVNVNYLKQGSGSPIGYDFTTAGATGEQPPNKGSGSSDYAYSGSASGERSPAGTGSAGYAYSGSAVGGTVRLIFEPPTQRQAVRGDTLFSRVSVPVGLSVVRTDGQYRTTPLPWLGELVGLKDGTDYFLGGHRYEVTNEVAAELQAAGYDVQSV